MALEHLKNLRVAVAVPSNGVWLTDFAISLIGMLQAFQEYKVGEYKTQGIQVISTKGSILPKSRLLAAQDALKMNSSHLLYLDSDHVFPPHLLHTLVMHDLDVVGLNCQTKTIPPSPTARYKPEEGDPVHGKPVFTYPGGPKLEKVWRVGCGVLLIKRKVLETINLKHAFDMFYRDDVENYQGEDWTLCSEIERCGFDIHVDHVMSWQTAHMGYFDYRHDLVPEALQLEAENRRPKLEIAK